MRKHTIILMVSAVAFIIATLSFNSCTKQENAGQPVDQQSQQPEITPEDIAIYNKIMDFKKEVDYIKENPMYKSGEEMSVDSAVWYLDAAVNLTHAYAFKSFEDFYTDSVFIEIPISEGEVNLDNISAGYFELIDKIRDDIYANVQENDKQLYSSSLSIKAQGNGTVTLKNTATIGSKSVDPEPDIEEPFIEDWEYGEDNALCDDNFAGSDAIHEISGATMLYKTDYIYDGGEPGDNWYAVYVLPEVEIEVISYEHYFNQAGLDVLLNSDDDILEDNYRDKLMFYQSSENSGAMDECIYADNMNFYYSGVHEVIYDIIPANSGSIEGWEETQGLTFFDISYILGHFTGTPTNKTKLYHHLNIKYRRRLIASTGDLPKPIE